MRRADLEAADRVVAVNLDPPLPLPNGALIGVPVTEGKTAEACGYRANVSIPWISDATCRLTVINATFSVCK